MKKIKWLFIQIGITLGLLLFVNGFSWLFVHLRDDATFIDNGNWSNLPVFKNKIFASNLWQENQFVKYEYMAFTGWKQTQYRGKYIKTNQYGERNNFHSNVGQEKKIKIRLFGGSTMWGVGASDDSTIVAFLQKKNVNRLVYNHGIQGFNSRQSLDRLLTLYELGDTADVVVFYDGVNEMSMCAKSISLPGHYQEDLFRQKMISKNTLISSFDIIREGIYFAFLKNTLEFTQRIHKRVFQTKEKTLCTDGFVCKCDTLRTQIIAKMLIKNWEISKNIVEHKGGKFIAILQPVFSEGEPNLSYLDFGSNNLKELHENYKSLYGEIKKQIKEKKLDWIHDLTDTLDGSEPYYIDYCHVNAVANLKISKKIDSILVHSPF